MLDYVHITPAKGSTMSDKIERAYATYREALADSSYAYVYATNRDDYPAAVGVVANGKLEHVGLFPTTAMAVRVATAMAPGGVVDVLSSVGSVAR